MSWAHTPMVGREEWTASEAFAGSPTLREGRDMGNAARDPFRAARDLLHDGAGRVYSGATLLVARAGRVVLEEAAGSTAHPGLGVSPRPVGPDTVFDLASLTKPLAASAIAMVLVARGRLDLDARLGDCLPAARRSDKADLGVADLLAHGAGLPAWRPYGADLVRARGEAVAGTLEARRAVLSAILREPLEQAPGTRAVYSDLGYILLGLACERLAGARLDRLFARWIARPLGLRRTFFVPVWRGVAQDPPVPTHDIAATERCPTRGRVLQGEVHDDNAFVLGGVAGHAGLFGTARDVWTLLDAMTDAAGTVFDPGVAREFRSLARAVPGSGRTLAFDTPAPEASSAGTCCPGGLVGHLGFTGTSFWLHPEARTAVVLLTNRVHPTRDNDEVRAFRPALHDLIWKALGI